MNAAEEAILDHAPVGSLWRHLHTPDAPLLVCAGLHANWRDPSEWAFGVSAEPLVWLDRADAAGNPAGVDRVTVTLAELRQGYERVHVEGGASDGTIRNREKRRAKTERVKTDAVQFLLDGLEVGSIGELKRLVDEARAADRLRGMVLQDAEWARDVLHAGTYKAGGSHPGDRALAYLERIIERTGDRDGS